MTTKELLERIDARLAEHEAAVVNAKPLPVVPVEEVADFGLLFDAHMVTWIGDMPVVHD
jgi:hypothetical protein